MKKITSSLKIGILALVLSFGVSYVFADWNAPTATAPNNNTPTPLNVGSTEQTKAGSINIVTGKAYKYGANATTLTGGVDIAKAIVSLNNFFFGNSGNLTMTGQGNTSVGGSSLLSNTTGSFNTTLGFESLKVNTSSDENTAIGYRSLFSNVGSVVNYNPAGRNTAIGASAMGSNTTGNYNVSVGWNSQAGGSTGSFNTVVGASALGGGDNSTVVGYGAGGTGTNLVAFGSGSGKSSGANNTAIGINTLSGSNNSGGNNTAVGSNTLFYNTTGANNTALGSSALQGNINGGTASNNTAIGVSALSILGRGISNTAVGVGALVATQGNYNIANSASSNTAVGQYALSSNITGSSNTAIGAGADTGGGNASTLTNATAIGYNAKVLLSDSIKLGNNNVTSVITTGAITSARNIMGAWFDCAGTLGSCYRASSDFRLKKDIKEDNLGLDFILKLRPVTFKYKKGAGNTLNGLIAQEVEQALKDLGTNFSGLIRPSPINEYYSLDYSNFVVPLINAVQAQQKEINELKAKNADFEARLKAIEAKLK